MTRLKTASSVKMPLHGLRMGVTVYGLLTKAYRLNNGNGKIVFG